MAYALLGAMDISKYVKTFVVVVVVPKTRASRSLWRKGFLSLPVQLTAREPKTDEDGHVRRQNGLIDEHDGTRLRSAYTPMCMVHSMQD